VIWIARLPGWLLAAILTSLATAVTFIPIEHLLYERSGRFYSVPVDVLPIVALFLTGAVRRLNWRHAIILAVVAVAAWWLADVCHRNVRVGFPYSMFYWQVPLLALLEWILDRPRRVGALLCVMAFSLIIVCILPAVELLTYDKFFVVPLPFGSRCHIAASLLISLPVIGAVTWLAISAAQRLALRQDSRAVQTAVTFTILSLAWFITFFHYEVYKLALRSLVKGTPFDRSTALWVLQARMNSGDEAEIWRLFESRKWQPGFTGDPDTHGQSMRILAEHDPSGAAIRLSSLLRMRPGPRLAESAAMLFATEHRYETAPELMRYALTDSGQSRATEALESMSIPQAALAVLRDDADQRWGVVGGTIAPDSTINPWTEQRLAKLLGKDVGAKWWDWSRLYDSTVDTCPTPLSATEKSEVDRVARAITMYWSASSRLAGAGSATRVPEPNFDIPTTAGLEDEIRRYCAAVDAIIPTTGPSQH
jgi:hypothetical protein